LPQRHSPGGTGRAGGLASSYVSHIERGEHVPSLTVILNDLLSDFTFPAMKKLKLNG
jgi:hypothetical protein